MDISLPKLKTTRDEAHQAKPSKIKDAPAPRSMPERLRDHVTELCKIPRYNINPAGIKQATDFIKKELEAIGLNVEEQKFNVKNFITQASEEHKNLIVSIGAKDGERIIVGAHYDTDGLEHKATNEPKTQIDIGDGIKLDLRINPGADDNASAVAGLIETARLLKSMEQELIQKNIRVDLVAYANEEAPYYHSKDMGSYVHAKSLKEKGAKVKGMICYEMIGYFSDKAKSQSYLEKITEELDDKSLKAKLIKWLIKIPNLFFKLFYPSKGNFIAVVGNMKSRKLVKAIKQGMSGINLKIRSLFAPDKLVPLIGLSDHSSYWKWDFPAVMVTDTAFLRNPNYHKATDTPETLNYEKMSEVVKGVVKAVKELCK